MPWSEAALAARMRRVSVPAELQPSAIGLASTSPRRRELLERAGIAFVLIRPGDEPAAAGSPRDKAVARARAKAGGAQASGGLHVLGVDTVVDVDGVEFGKPRDVADAERMLRQLAGRRHLVHTAHCLLVAGREPIEELATSEVVGREVDEERLCAYLQSGLWRGKAGAYGIQDDEQPFLELLSGSMDTVIGLSVDAVRRMLAEVAG